MLIGYARVSALIKIRSTRSIPLMKPDAKEIYGKILRQQETKTVAGSPQLYAWRRYACGLEISRLTRSLTQLISTVKDLEEWQIGLKVITQNIDISTPEGGLFFHMSAAFDQFQRKIIVENTQAELKSARKNGRTGSRPTLHDR